MAPEEKTLQELAAEIAARGATGDPVTMLLAKGVADGMSNVTKLADLLAGLVKGGPPPKKKKDDDDPPADDGGDEGDDGAPGYEDMNMSTRARIAPPAPAPVGADGVLDVTAFVFQTADAIQRLEKGRADDQKTIAKLLDLAKAQGAQIQTLGQMIETSNAAVMGTVVPLTKAVSDQREQLLQIPAPGITPHRITPRRPIAAGPIGGSKVIETRALAKALNTGTIDGYAKAMWLREGSFDPANEVRAAQLRAAVEKFVPEVS